MKMQRRGDPYLFLTGLICVAVVPLLTTVCIGGELNESKFLFSFIGSIDPQNKLGSQWKQFSENPCLHKSMGIKCNLQGTSILEIRLENLNLSRIIDADALCKLQNIEVLSLARTLIHGTIPSSISYCTRLRYLNLSSNSFSGIVPTALTKLKYLRSLDISNNQFSRISLHIKSEFKHVYSKEPISLQGDAQVYETRVNDIAPSAHPKQAIHRNSVFFTLMFLFIGIGFFFLFLYHMRKRSNKIKKEKEILTAVKESPLKLPPVNPTKEANLEDRHQDLVFFVKEEESFKLDDLLDASADLRSQSLCSSLYKVTLKNNASYAVKRLKKLQVSFEEFGQTMRQIGNLRHQNILPLVGYNSSTEEKLLFYKYQTHGSLLNLLEEYIEGKRDFPWRLRLTIASGIAKGLAFIYQSSNNDMVIPHGNLKPSNILLGGNMEPLISEYGISRLLDPKKHHLFSSNGYVAPEKSLSEQGDVFSFGVILLELLTGKTVEKTGVDLPKWVKSMVREEWTGEVFDKEVSRAGLQWAFPLLNVALKCVSHSSQDRPTTSEVLEKIEEALFGHEDRSISSISSLDSRHGHPDCCILHSVIPETWDTPGSNY